jgi:hypothetical protein
MPTDMEGIMRVWILPILSPRDCFLKVFDLPKAEEILIGTHIPEKGTLHAAAISQAYSHDTQA